MSVAAALTGWLDNIWLRIIVTSLLNHLTFTKAMATLEPVFAPFQDSQGALGPIPSRIWSAREWQAIKIKSFCISLALSVIHLASPEMGPYLLLWACLLLPAAKHVATGLSPRTPQGKWQFWSTRMADTLMQLPPFQYLPDLYKAPVALLAAILLLLWAIYFGFQQALPWFIVSGNNSKHLFIN
jgi:hypothetical protein